MLWVAKGADWAAAHNWTTHGGINDGLILVQPSLKEKEKTRDLHESARGLPRFVCMRREDAFIHSLSNGRGRRRAKYLHCVHGLLLASARELRWSWYWGKRWWDS